MTYDYTRVRDTAERLVKRFGRTVTLVRPTEIKDDHDRPWKGPSVNSDVNPDTKLQVPAIQLLPNQVRIFGLSAIGESHMLDGLVSKSEYVYIIFQGEVDIRQFTFVEDRAVTYQIEATQSLRPANVTLLGYIGVRR